MAKRVNLLNKSIGVTRPGYYGFSWTYLFFGWWVPLFRGEVGIALIHAVLWIFTFGTWQIIMAFLYNKQYMIRMLEKGYELSDEEQTMDAARRTLGLIKV